MSGHLVDAGLRVCVGIALFVLVNRPVEAANYTVKQDGSGSFTTIQACASAAMAGDSCIVHAGTFNEHVATVRSGLDTARITFRALGTVTMQGFQIDHAYISVDGFRITGFGTQYDAHIRIRPDGDNCEILNNTIFDGAKNVYGLWFNGRVDSAPDDCLVRGNTFSNLDYVFLSTSGRGHLFEANTFTVQNGQDYVRLFGAGLIFRRNIFWNGTSSSGGNHPDFVQTFGGPGLEAQDILFEENWIQGLSSQLAQMNSGDGVVSRGILSSQVKNLVFRRNIVVDVSMNANMGMPGVRFENNTFYRMAYQANGIGFNGSLTRGDASYAVLKNNVYLEGGARAELRNDSSGFYYLGGAAMSREVISALVVNDWNTQLTSGGIFNDIRQSQYVNSNGLVLPKAVGLTSISQFQLDSRYTQYKKAIFDILVKTVQLDQKMRATFEADYNFVAGASSAGFPAKRSFACGARSTYVDFNFCEPHGINGGNPHLRDLEDLLGPDGAPFTLDDGLKPLTTSPLCGNGHDNVDIGAYSCDPTKVFSDGGIVPAAPTNLRILP